MISVVEGVETASMCWHGTGWNGPFDAACSMHALTFKPAPYWPKDAAGNTKGESITVLLTSCLTGLD